MRAPHRLGAALLAVGLTSLPQPTVTPSATSTGTASLAAATTTAAPPRCDGRVATLVGSSGDDRLEGTRGSDVIVGRGGDDRIDGRGGKDVICGNAGADVLRGGSQNDRLLGGRDRRAVGPGGSYLSGDVLVGGGGADLLDGGADTRRADQRRRPDTYSYAASGRGVRIDLGGRGHGTARGEGRDRIVLGPVNGIVGSAHADRITGSRHHDVVQGGHGNDAIATGRGGDRVFPDRGRKRAGNDVVSTGRGNDLVSSLAGRDRIETGAGADFVEAFSSRPTRVRTGGGDDYLGQYVAPGRRALSDGGRGNDVVAFYGTLLAERGAGARFVVDYRSGGYRDGRGSARGGIDGFEGHRFVGSLRWSFFGTRGDDRVWAIEGGPLLARGYRGDDSFTGSPRDDRLFGGAGDDYAADSGGTDRCRGIERGDC